jgi:hypothetical protein
MELISYYRVHKSIPLGHILKRKLKPIHMITLTSLAPIYAEVNKYSINSVKVKLSLRFTKYKP